MDLLKKAIPRSSKTIAIMIFIVLALFIVDQYRNKDFFGLMKPKVV